MAEKWTEGDANSPEVVYDGLATPSFVGTEDDSSKTAATGATKADVGKKPKKRGEGSQQRESVITDRYRLCFVCCDTVSEKHYESIQTSMNHSHAPLIVLLTDVLGYKLEEKRLHSEVVCKACYHLLDIIDELQQTLAESKTDVRTKFLETIQRMKLRYPRTDKMLKPRCLRCVTSPKKRGRGRGWRGRDETGGKSRGRSKGRGRGSATKSDDEQYDSDEGQENGVDIAKLTLPSKSHQYPLPAQDDDDNTWQDQLTQELTQPQLLKPNRLGGHFNPSLLSKEKHCESVDFLSNGCFDMGISQSSINQTCLTETGNTTLDSDVQLSKQTKENLGFPEYDSDTELHTMFDDYSFESPVKKGSNFSFECECSNFDCLECHFCHSRGISYWYCDLCLICQGVFIPWGCNTSLEFIGSKCKLLNIKVQSQVNQGKLHIISRSVKFSKPTSVHRKQCSILKQTDKSIPDDKFTGDMSGSYDGGTKNFNTEKPISFGTESTEVTESEYKSDSKINDVKLDTENSMDSSSDVTNSKKENSYTYERDLFSEKSCSIDFEDIRRSLTMDRGDMEDLLSSPNLLGDGRKTIGSGDRLHNCDSREGITTPVPDRDIFFSPFSLSKCLGLDKDVKDAKVRLKFDVSDILLEDSNQSVADSNISLSSHKDQNISSISQHIVKDVPPKLRVYSNTSKQSPETKKCKTRGRKPKEEMLLMVSTEQPLGKRKRTLTKKAKENLEEEKAEISTKVVKTKQKKNAKTSGDCEKKIVNKKKELPSKNTEARKYICEYCGKRFGSNGGFQYHVDSHKENAKTYSCESCLYVTRRQADLKKHQVIHTGEKHYRCEVCNQEFSVNSSFKRHLRVHSLEKPYKCTTCGQEFRSSGNLKMHMVKHTGIKNHVCEVCGACFSLPHHYTVHRKLHSGESPYKCVYCKASFRNNFALRAHRKKAHPKEESKHLKQMKLRKTVVKGEIKVTRLTPCAPSKSASDAFEEAVAEAVDSTYECVDSSTRTFSLESAPSASSSGIPSCPNESQDNVEGSEINLDGDSSSRGISVQIDEGIESIATSMTLQETLRDIENCEIHLHASQAPEIFPNTLSHPVNISPEFLVVQGGEEALTSVKPAEVKINCRSEEPRATGGQMFIMLSNPQVQDSNLYFVVENGGQAPS